VLKGRMSVYDEWKEYLGRSGPDIFNVLQKHVLSTLVENIKPQSGWPLCRLRIEPAT
jgi:hypothetical protein